MILYKYCSLAGIKIFENKSIRVTPPNEFNDPFEFATTAIDGISVEQIKTLIKDEANVLERYKILSPSLQGISFEVFRQKELASLDDEVYLTGIASQASMLHQEWATNFVDQVSGTSGITCFTEDNNSILMWAHYAANHSGFVIGFNVSRLPEIKLFKVDYTNSAPPVIELVKLEHEGYLQAKFAEIMKSKSACWSYEREYRIQILLDLCKYVHSINMWFYQFSADVIEEVYLGLRCRPHDVKMIINILSADCLRHVRIYKALPVHGHYKIKYEQIR